MQKFSKKTPAPAANPYDAETASSVLSHNLDFFRRVLNEDAPGYAFNQFGLTWVMNKNQFGSNFVKFCGTLACHQNFSDGTNMLLIPVAQVPEFLERLVRATHKARLDSGFQSLIFPKGFCAVYDPKNPRSMLQEAGVNPVMDVLIIQNKSGVEALDAGVLGCTGDGLYFYSRTTHFGDVVIDGIEKTLQQALEQLAKLYQDADPPPKKKAPAKKSRDEDEDVENDEDDHDNDDELATLTLSLQGLKNPYYPKIQVFLSVANNACELVVFRQSKKCKLEKLGDIKIEPERNTWQVWASPINDEALCRSSVQAAFDFIVDGEV